MGDKDHKDNLKTYNKVMLHIDFEKWKQAMRSKINSIHSNQIWTLVDPPEGIVHIGYK